MSDSKGGWFRLHTEDLVSIRNAADAITFLPDVLATFLAISELADETRASVVTCTRRRISERSGVSLRQIDRTLPMLVQAGVVSIKANAIPGTKELGPSSYTLRHGGSTLRHGGEGLRQDEKNELAQLVPQTVHRLGQTKPDVGEKAAGAAPTSEIEDDVAWLSRLKTEKAYEGIDIDREYAKALRWCAEHHKQLTRRRFVNWLNRCDKPMTTHTSPINNTPIPKHTTQSIDPRNI